MADTEGRYTRIKSRFWSDEKVVAWSNDTKLLALYLLTSPHNNILGCYILPKLYICADLEWSTERLAKPFQRLLDDGFVKYDDNCRLVLITNYLQHNPIFNGNQATGAIKQLQELPKSPLLQDLKRSLERLDKPFLKPLIERIGDPVTVSVTVTVTEDLKDICASGDAQECNLPIDTKSKDPEKKEKAAGQDPEDDGAADIAGQDITPGEQRARKPFKSMRQENLFDQFWEIYPKKRSKGRAERAWVKINPSDDLFSEIMTSLQQAKLCPEWKKEGGQYIPYPASWLNSKGWEDEYTNHEVRDGGASRNQNQRNDIGTPGPSAETIRLEQIAREKGYIKDGEIRDIDCPF